MNYSYTMNRNVNAMQTITEQAEKPEQTLSESEEEFARLLREFMEDAPDKKSEE